MNRKNIEDINKMLEYAIKRRDEFERQNKKRNGGKKVKILIICSKAFYKDITPIKEQLEKNGHIVELPNSYYEPDAEKKSWDLGQQAHSEFKSRMFKMSEERISTMDAVLTLNFDKNGKKNYIGGATFIEIYEAFMKGKKIYLYNDIPEGMLYDEISGFSPIIINGNINLIK